MIEMKRQYGRTLSGWDMALRVIVVFTLEIAASAQVQVMQAIPQGQQLVVTGALTRNGATEGVTVTRQAPNKVRLDIQTEGAVVFDGAKPWAQGVTLTSENEDLLESLVDDSPEGIFTAMVAGIRHPVLLLRRVEINAANPAAAVGRILDVYDLYGPVRGRSAEVVRRKRAFFDTDTLLLNHVYYRVNDSTGEHGIYVVRDNWRRVNNGFVAPSRP
ncbi:MAG TPA: hypothetical protein VHD76_01375 [Bryobacteraceae bacterium]|nr:hypothetical protein [Bryobacteraceae bacterium]